MYRAFVAFICLVILPAAAQGDPTSELEIQYLLSEIEQAPCLFIRNGKEYDGEEARDHIERKYRYILNRGHEPTAEQFIEFAATKSSFSGRAYQIQCPDQPPEPSATWLLRALETYRNGSGR
ncbi:DUF5329 domain-containing protein [Ferrimonas balearica]|uniref:DUF5329 domain-containing protein n=1 Tax=Ferrimonas balearica TaxID=44012 RepID=UPI001C997732|nr:DUF5329 domain-containing protein [Ferrimonas balearica]MBY5920568.1 DUF5329 domain-containing protein [Ferrimonas balearica]MBY5996747.1 DUF5329 domain-containing protein [Ferrimonas balearica]